MNTFFRKGSSTPWASKESLCIIGNVWWKWEANCFMRLFGVWLMNIVWPSVKEFKSSRMPEEVQQLIVLIVASTHYLIRFFFFQWYELQSQNTWLSNKTFFLQKNKKQKVITFFHLLGLAQVIHFTYLSFFWNCHHVWTPRAQPLACLLTVAGTVRRQSVPQGAQRGIAHNGVTRLRGSRGSPREGVRDSVRGLRVARLRLGGAHPSVRPVVVVAGEALVASDPVDAEHLSLARLRPAALVHIWKAERSGGEDIPAAAPASARRWPTQFIFRLQICSTLNFWALFYDATTNWDMFLMGYYAPGRRKAARS